MAVPCLGVHDDGEEGDDEDDKDDDGDGKFKPDGSDLDGDEFAEKILLG